MADYGAALKALSEGSAVCLQAQIGKNVKYTERVKSAGAVSPEVNRAANNLRPVTEQLREELKTEKQRGLGRAKTKGKGGRRTKGRATSQAG